MTIYDIIVREGLQTLIGKIKGLLNLKQDTLKSGTNIKTINNESLLGSGNIDIKGVPDLTANKVVITDGSKNLSTSTVSSTELGYLSGAKSNIQSQINNKQDTLVSGTNIKTINNESILGSGNIEISGSSTQSDWNETDSKNPAFIKNKPDLTTYLKTDGSNASEKTAETILNKIETPGGNLLTDDGSIIATTAGGTDWFKTKLSNLWSWIKNKTNKIYLGKVSFVYDMSKSTKVGERWFRIIKTVNSSGAEKGFWGVPLLVNITNGYNSRGTNSVTFITQAQWKFPELNVISRNNRVDYIKALRVVYGPDNSSTVYIDIKLNADIKESNNNNNNLNITFIPLGVEYVPNWEPVTEYTEIDSLDEGQLSREVVCSYTSGIYSGGCFEALDRIVGSKFVKRNGTSTQFLMADGSVKTLGVDVAKYDHEHTTLTTPSGSKVSPGEFKINSIMQNRFILGSSISIYAPTSSLSPKDVNIIPVGNGDGTTRMSWSTVSLDDLATKEWVQNNTINTEAIDEINQSISQTQNWINTYAAAAYSKSLRIANKINEYTTTGTSLGQMDCCGSIIQKYSTWNNTNRTYTAKIDLIIALRSSSSDFIKNSSVGVVGGCRVKISNTSNTAQYIVVNAIVTKTATSMGSLVIHDIVANTTMDVVSILGATTNLRFSLYN